MQRKRAAQLARETIVAQPRETPWKWVLGCFKITPETWRIAVKRSLPQKRPPGRVFGSPYLP